MCDVFVDVGRGVKTFNINLKDLERGAEGRTFRAAQSCWALRSCLVPGLEEESISESGELHYRVDGGSDGIWRRLLRLLEYQSPDGEVFS